MLKTLKPTAEVHRSRDLTRLKGHISEAVDFLRKLPFKVSEDLRLYLDIAYNSVREPVRRSVKEREEAQLNLYDEESMYID